MEIDREKFYALAAKQGWEYCADGAFAEMGMHIADYREKTSPIPGITFDFYSGSLEQLHALVAQVEPEWVQFFSENTPVFCAYENGDPISFCIVEADDCCPLAVPGVRVGSIGCVGTLPACRGRKIGLRMVDLATCWLKNQDFPLAYISYTAIDHWYAKLGYQVYARFRLKKA